MKPTEGFVDVVKKKVIHKPMSFTKNEIERFGLDKDWILTTPIRNNIQPKQNIFTKIYNWFNHKFPNV